MYEFDHSELDINCGDSYTSSSQHLLHIQNPRPLQVQNYELRHIARHPGPMRQPQQSYQPITPHDGSGEYTEHIEQTVLEDTAVSARSASGTHSVSDQDRSELPNRTISRSWPKRVALFTDCFLTLLPIVFLVFGFCALALDKRPLSAFGDNILEGMKFGPSIFPVVFAALAGRLMRAIAQWRAELGTKLSLLEQLVGSQSISSTIQMMVSLGRYGPLSIAIAGLWSLSLLGGQSSLRMLVVKPSSVPSEAQISYFDVKYTDDTEFGYGDVITRSSTTAVFTTGLMASKQVKSSPVDVWNNVKIPMINEMSPWTKEITGNPWITIDPSSTDLVYSSLNGLMLSGLQSTGVFNFSIETTYMQLHCGDAQLFDPRKINGSGGLEYDYSYIFPNGLTYGNASNLFQGGGGDFFFASESMRVGEMRNNTTSTVFFGSRYDPHLYTRIAIFNCSFGTTSVEAAVSCNGTSCAVDSVRRSTIDRTPFNRVPFLGSASFNFFRFLESAIKAPHITMTSQISLYVRGSDSPFAVTSIPPNISQVPAAEVARRLSTLFNTAWQASLAPLSIPLGSAATWTQNVSQISGPTSDEGIWAMRYFANTTKASVATPVLLYHTNRQFVGIFIAITIILQACAIAGLFIKYSNTGPDILGYVSSLTRDNPHIKSSIEGNGLHGLERAKMLSDLKVQIGDVKPRDKIGHIAFKSLQAGEDYDVARVRKGRQYQ